MKEKTVEEISKFARDCIRKAKITNLMHHSFRIDNIHKYNKERYEVRCSLISGVDNKKREHWLLCFDAITGKVLNPGGKRVEELMNEIDERKW